MVDDKLYKLEKALKNKYPDCNFYIHSNDKDIEIIYSNRKYLNNDEFLDEVLKVAKDYLSEYELWNIVTTYDIHNQIPNYEQVLEKSQNDITETNKNCKDILKEEE